ncbi:MAG TPA: redoxin domain-containing protein [Alphaproteobacteria bacterium]|jgi:peroxiredoxin/predicted 2-oxoglutarate/Fe(II)-dependent dioxygenase YbiX|nr:redoxin domain-containing protein [Alphaproteobacteria bacterium]
MSAPEEGRAKVFAIARPPSPAAVLRGEAPPLRLEPGDHPPPFQLRDHNERLTSPWEVGFSGGPVALVFTAGVATDGHATELDAYRDELTAFARHRLAVFAIIDGTPEANRALAAGHRLNFPILCDPKGAVRRAYGFGDLANGAVSLLLDGNRRVAAIIDRPGNAPHAMRLRRLIEDKPAPPAAMLGPHPPVLVVPRALSRADCAMLIDYYARPAPVWEPDPVTQDCDAYRLEKGDFKLRENLYGNVVQLVVRAAELQSYIDAKLMRRLIPEIETAFQTTITHREAYRIACYDAAEDGGLPQHRDNNSPATRFRRFTASVVLNAGEYEGGQLRFREYGEQIYEVETGSAIIWSASLLHEVLRVTKGRRFMLGTHMSGG